MNIFDNFRLALRALAANKMRAILTMLGIIIGVGSVVALMAIGNGATASITSQVEGIGSNLINIIPGRIQQGGVSAQGLLTLGDYEALQRELKGVAGIAPSTQVNGTLTFGPESVNAQVSATTPDFALARSYTVARGRFLTEADRQQRARVVVLGAQTAKDLFGGVQPLGRTVKINGLSFTVVGVLNSKGASGFGSADELALVPLETGLAKLGAARSTHGDYLLSTIAVSAANADAVDPAIAAAEKILRREHRLKTSDTADFTVMSQTQFLSALSTITTTLTIFLGAIAGISLLVGGIGIMNIMLVSVTERTKEIGLRKAVGAPSRAILSQFLVETLVLSLTGGLVGVGLGVGVAGLVTVLGLITAQVTANSIFMAFGFAAAVGLFFGIYPAWRAAQLRPIEALRYE